MERHLNVAVLSFVLFAAVIVKNANTLKVKVYYVTNCTPCERFITDQLLPTYKAINNRDYSNYREANHLIDMAVKLVPFGETFKLTQLENGTWQIKCKEWAHTSCVYNKFHACAIDIGTTPWNSLNFISAMVESNYQNLARSAALTCFEDSRMSTCVNTVDGDELLIAHGRDTLALNVSLERPPIVTFDGKYDEGEQQAARENLLSLVCDKLGNVPAACASPRAKRVMTHGNFGTGVYYPKRTRCEY